MIYSHSIGSFDTMVKELPDQVGYQPHKGSPKLLDQVRLILRRQHYSIRTEEAYTHWIIRFIRFHKLRHPQEMDTPEIEAFLTHLAVDLRVAASTQNHTKKSFRPRRPAEAGRRGNVRP